MSSKKAKEKEEKKDINIFESRYVPKHVVLAPDEKAEFLKQYNITVKQLPRIKESDAAVKMTGAKKGDVLKIIRNSPVAGEAVYYRVVV
ncbi:MAG: DNA-directed RNA polymerase subunit H [Candidatus Aenigmarchaeota archaeon]|nr:DNA-directed RNA polymerase subunit H [Candidatus Aenigmarchaeota archaeon]